MSKIIIGISGRARAGKDEMARYLEKYHAFHHDSFAAPVRQAIIQILGLNSLKELDEIKHLPHPILKNNTPRYAMQTMGTEWGRGMISDSIWIDSCLNRIQKYDRVVISDVRFDNEAIAIKNAGGLIIRVNRPGEEIPESAHKSESGISDDLIDRVIENDTCLDNLYSNGETLMKSIFRRMG